MIKKFKKNSRCGFGIRNPKLIFILKGEIITKKRIFAIVLAWVLLFSNVGGPLICYAKACSQTEQGEIEEENDILPDAGEIQERAGTKMLPAVTEAMSDRSERY